MKLVNTEELKNWIVNHSNYYRKAIREARVEYEKHAPNVYSYLKNRYTGQVHAMRALWDTLDFYSIYDSVGLYKNDDYLNLTKEN